MKQCNRCESTDLVRIQYGYPDAELRQQAAQGHFMLGGCRRTDDDPTLGCRICGAMNWPDNRYRDNRVRIAYRVEDTPTPFIVEVLYEGGALVRNLVTDDTTYLSQDDIELRRGTSPARMWTRWN